MELGQALECYKGDSILNLGERIQCVAPSWLANISTTLLYLEWEGTNTKQYLQAIYTQFNWNLLKLSKSEVYSVHMLAQIFFIPLFNK